MITKKQLSQAQTLKQFENKIWTVFSHTHEQWATCLHFSSCPQEALLCELCSSHKWACLLLLLSPSSYSSGRKGMDWTLTGKMSRCKFCKGFWKYEQLGLIESCSLIIEGSYHSLVIYGFVYLRRIILHVIVIVIVSDRQWSSECVGVCACVCSSFTPD